MKLKVTENAKKNIVFGAFNRIIIMICPFIERTVIQKYLGSEYLGLGSLFSSIILVLSLSELGFSTAIVYSLYKPTADGDMKAVNAIIAFYRSAYRIIGVVILAIGLIISPFVPKFINGTPPEGCNVYLLFYVYLFNTVISYFLYAYLSPVIVVNQRDDINSAINSTVKILLTITQILCVILTRNYFLFCLMLPVFTIINNLLIGWRVKKEFPEFHPEGHIDDKTKRDIKKSVVGTFIQQACTVTRNALDSICISAFIGLSLTAIYNNYYTIINSVSAFVGIISAAFIGGVGHHVATKSVDENYSELKNLDFIYLWIGGWCTICLICLYQPFMTIWMGEKMLLPNISVILLSLYFYLLKLGDMRYLYTAAKGLWWEQRYRASVETVLNLVLNILLGKLFGVNGIIIATIISLFLCNYIWSVNIVFGNYFGKQYLNKYYFYQTKYSISILVACFATYFLCSLCSFESTVLVLFVRTIICIIIPNIIMFLLYRNTSEFQYAYTHIVPNSLKRKL